EQGKVVGPDEMISEFWTSVIWSDHVKVELHRTSQHSGFQHDNYYGFDIDVVAYGYSLKRIQDIIDGSRQSRTVCAQDNREDAACYEGTEIGRKSDAVCRLLIGGGGLCTGWLLGCEGNVITNNHCIGSAAAAQNTDFLFNFQTTTCGGAAQATADLVASTSQLVTTSGNLDFTMVALPVNPTLTYGYLSFSSIAPAVNERIYIPQHPGGGDKRIAVNTDVGGDINGFVRVTDAGGGNSRVEYFGDTQGGSSGSPVIRFSDHLVVAVHNTGGCPNGAFARNIEVINVIGANMPNCGIDDPNPIGPAIALDQTEVEVTELTDCDFQDVDFTLSIAQAPTQDAEITVAINGGTATNNLDFEVLTPTVTFPTGSDADQVVTIRIHHDAFVENEETILINLDLNTNGGDAFYRADSTLSIFITDADEAPDFSVETALVSEDFEGSLANWTITGNGTTNFALGIAQVAISANWNAGGNTTRFMFVNDDDCDCDMSQERIALNAPQDFSNLVGAGVTFDYSYNAGSGNSRSEAYVQVSLDGGATWSNVGDELVSTPDIGDTWKTVSRDLSAYIGQSNVMISFLYNDLGNSSFGLAIDNVSVNMKDRVPVQTDVNTAISDDRVPLRSQGVIYAYDEASGHVMAGMENNTSTDFGCLDVAVATDGTGAADYAGTEYVPRALEKTFTVSAENAGATGDVDLTFYFTEAEVAGWEAAVNVGSRADLVLLKDDGATVETIPVTLGAYGDDVAMSANVSTLNGTYVFASQIILSVDEAAGAANDFIVYPNPAREQLFIKSDRLPQSLTVYNMLGEQMTSLQVVGSGDMTMDISGLAPGVYVLEIQEDSGSTTHRFVKQ
ncbi:MAG: trypsin-like peptidase domain-containing protein, partial [Bacteroidota bacterium]